MKLFSQRGFTYPELLVVVMIFVLIFLAAVPLYKRFNTLQELKNTSQAIRDQLRVAQNKATNGVTGSNGLVSHWIVHLHHTSFEYEYETGACPVVTDSTAGGYSNRYNFNSCPNRSDYVLYDFPQRFSISHQYPSESEVNIFFSSINGSVTIYSGSGAYLGNEVDIKISSDEYTDMYVILRVNGSGNISEERMIE
jgi:prepilin-type N-terminal cleavage/methylation domain-containing protein